MDERVTLLQNFQLKVEIVGDMVMAKLAFPPSMESLTAYQPLCDDLSLSVFAKYTTKNGMAYEPHRYFLFRYKSPFKLTFAIRYPLKIRRKSNMYLNPYMLMETHLTHLTALTAENFWKFVEKLSGEGLKVKSDLKVRILVLSSKQNILTH